MSDNLLKRITAYNDSFARAVAAGAHVERRHFHTALNCLQREFQAAQLRPETRIPTSLEMAILNALALLPQE